MPGWLNSSLLVNVIDGVSVGALLFLLAVGLTMIFGLVNILNLAHGALYMAGGYAGFLILGGGSPRLLALIGVCALVLIVGAVLGRGLDFSVRPIAARGHLDQALLTLGLSILLSEALLLGVGRGFHSLGVPHQLNGSVPLLGHSYPVYRLIVIGVGLAVASLTYVVFERTRLGGLARAAVDDPEMLAAVGIDVRKIRAGVIMSGSALALVAGVLGAPLLNLQPGLDMQVLVLSLIVVVVGGLGSIKGAAVGALIIGLVQTLGVSLFPTVAAYALFGVMILVLLIRPSGLFGRRSA
jgi:branched-chain amino acid transport system permease protein